MAIIYSYPNGSSALASDTLTITRSSIDFPVPNPTFTLTVAQIAAFVQSQLAGGTPNYIPVFNTSNTIIDSSMYLDDFTTPTLLTIGNDTKIQGNLTLEQDQADTTITIISDGSNIGEQHNPSIQFIQDGGVQNAAIGFNIIDDTGGGTIPGTGNRFWIVNAMDDTLGAGGITFGTAQVDGWDNAIARFMIRGDGKGLFGHPNTNYAKTLDSQFEIYDDRTENSTSDYSLSVLGVADISDPGGTGGAGGIISRLTLVNGATNPPAFVSNHAIGMVTGTTSSEILATGDLAFYVGSDMDTSSATGFAGTIHDSGNWQIGGTGSGDADPGYQLYVAGDAWVSGAFLDSGQNEGTAGQVLTSTGTGTAWAGGSTGTVSGVGQTGKLPLWTDGPAGEIGDSQLTQFGPTSNGLYQLRLDNADRFIINKPSSVTSGDPEYLIQQDGNYKVSMGWDDDGAGFGYLYNWAGDGWRFGSAGNNPELTIVTTTGSQGVEVVNNFSVGGLTTIQGDIAIENGLLDGNGLYGNAGQVLSSTGTGQNVVWADSTVGAFKEVNEGNGLGIVKQSRNSNYYAPIGNEAFDASHSGSPSSTRGAGGDYSVALGENSSAIGDYSFSFGNNVRAFSDYDIVLGHDSEATGGNSVSLGYNNIASGPVSTAIGYYANASGDNSVAMGWRVNATAAESNVFGKYNLTTDELFVVGNGDNSQRSDLLVGKDSGVILAPSLEISEILDPKCLITLEYITTIAAGVIGTGTEETIPVWINGNPSVTLSDSVISQVAGAAYNSTKTVVIKGGIKQEDTGRSVIIGDGALPIGNQSAVGENVAVGDLSLGQITTGTNNIGIGYSTLANNATGRNNIAIGKNALTTTQPNTSINNISLGFNTLANSTSVGSENVVIGHLATDNLISSSVSSNVIIGSSALKGANATTSLVQDNVLIGESVLDIAGFSGGVNTLSGCVFIGKRAAGLYKNIASNDIGIGNGAFLGSNNGFNSAGENVAIGSGAQGFNTEIGNIRSIKIGSDAGVAGSYAVNVSAVNTSNYSVNYSQGEHAALIGGANNSIMNADAAFIGSGRENVIEQGATGGAILGGYDNRISSAGSAGMALGSNLQVNGSNQVVAGRYNASNNNSKFIVGAGFSNANRKNAFEVMNTSQIRLAQYPSNFAPTAGATDIDLLVLQPNGFVYRMPSVAFQNGGIYQPSRELSVSSGSTQFEGPNVARFTKLSWTGTDGTTQIRLPDASGTTSPTMDNRVVEYLTDGSFAGGIKAVSFYVNNSGTINGATSKIISGEYKSIKFWSDGSEWYIVNEVS